MVITGYPLLSIQRTFSVMSEELRLLGNTSIFDMSDSSLIRGLRLLGGSNPDRTGSNSQNTYRVRRADLSDQALSLLKADGARSVMPKRSRQQDAIAVILQGCRRSI